jgi:hypothetical protein
MKPDHISQRVQRQCGIPRHLVDRLPIEREDHSVAWEASLPQHSLPPARDRTFGRSGSPPSASCLRPPSTPLSASSAKDAGMTHVSQAFSKLRLSRLLLGITLVGYEPPKADAGDGRLSVFMSGSGSVRLWAM